MTMEVKKVKFKNKIIQNYTKHKQKLHRPYSERGNLFTSVNKTVSAVTSQAMSSVHISEKVDENCGN